MINNPILKNIFKDPRTLLLIFLSLFAVYALTTPSFSRSPSEFFATLGTCILLDFLFLKFYKGVTLFPKSGMISSFGIFLLCDSPYLWVYLLLALFTIFSKHLLTYDGKHFFNPNNFALVLGVLFLQDKMTIVAGTWGGNFLLIPLISFLGILLVYRANRLYLTLSFLAAFILLALPRSFLAETSFFWVLLPLTGPSFFLYVFYMLTDPKTTPNNKMGQVLFGIALALIDAIFRYYKNKYAAVLSLFILTGSYPLISYFIRTKILNKFIKRY